MNQRCINAVLMAVFVLAMHPARADEPVLPGKGFDAARYEVLWTKSPFSVASSTEPVASPDYTLTGLAQFDGVSYASLVDKQKQEHFVLTSDKPMNGLTLVSVARAEDPTKSSAVIQRNGETISLKLEAPSIAAVPLPPPNGGQVFNPLTPTTPPMPNPQGQNRAALGPAQTPPPPLFHRHPIMVPQRPH